MAAAPSTYLAFDFGARRIGMAVGDSLTGTARPLPTVDHHLAPDWRAIEACLRDWRPAALVVGLPLDEDGGEQPMSAQARHFARQLQQRSGLPVHLADERYSSRVADDVLRHARASGQMTRRVRKGDRDGQAARLLLEQWLQSAGLA